MRMSGIQADVCYGSCHLQDRQIHTDSMKRPRVLGPGVIEAKARSNGSQQAFQAEHQAEKCKSAWAPLATALH